MGDYSGITWSGTKFYPFWNDPSTDPVNSLQQVWTCGINTVVLAHDFACGPFLSLPSNPVVINTPYNITSQIQNVGSSNESGVPIKFFADGVLVNTTNVNENAGQIDSVTNSWQTSAAGNHTLMYVSALATDQDRTNDTVRTTINVIASLPPLCEQFTSPTFPPVGWSLTNGGAYWSWNSVSSFGIGSGSAMYNMWSAPSGEDEGLITLSFPPVPAQTPFGMDIAYAPYPSNPPYSQDSLIILTSTDGGNNYTSLARLGPTDMQTAPASDAEFTPDASQWKQLMYLLPASTNKIEFLGRSQFGNDMFIDSTCVQYVIGITHNGSTIPSVYSLGQNYPNPFNPTTSINFGLPKAGLVKIVIYDILGRVVSTLVNEVRQAGVYKVDFDAANLASGVYFYKIDAGDFSSVKKMLLVK